MAMAGRKPKPTALDSKYATAIVMRYANEYGTENIRLLRNGEELPYGAVVPQKDEHE